MKSLFALSILCVLGLTACGTNGYYYGSSSAGYYQRPSYYQPSYPRSGRCYNQDNIVVGPQYYVTRNNYPGPVNYRNYSDAPVVVRSPYGSSRIIPKSWD
jgi:hypothetical protein